MRSNTEPSRLILLLFPLLLTIPMTAAAEQHMRSLRVEGAFIFHMNNSLVGEYVVPVDKASSAGFDLGASYGVRDALNSVSAGVTYYPFRSDGTGLFANLSAIYGFAQAPVQGQDGVDFRTSLMAGYREIVLDVVTGSIAISGNYDQLSGNPGAFVQGLNWGFSVSLGLAL
jgi:hypothetical protein